MKPTIGRIVHFRSRTGKYTCAAIITATKDTLYQPGVDAGHVPDLSSDTHVHLSVFTPGDSNIKRADAKDFVVPGKLPPQNSVNGTYQEFDVPFTDALASNQEAGTWMWPPRV
jgi:hypothetical protein